MHLIIMEDPSLAEYHEIFSLLQKLHGMLNGGEGRVVPIYRKGTEIRHKLSLDSIELVIGCHVTEILVTHGVDHRRVVHALVRGTDEICPLVMQALLPGYFLAEEKRSGSPAQRPHHRRKLPVDVAPAVGGKIELGGLWGLCSDHSCPSLKQRYLYR